MLFKKILKIKVQAAKFSSRVCFLSSSCVVGGPAFFPQTVFSSCLFWSESSTGACPGPGPLSEAVCFPRKRLVQFELPLQFEAEVGSARGKMPGEVPCLFSARPEGCSGSFACSDFSVTPEFLPGWRACPGHGKQGWQGARGQGVCGGGARSAVVNRMPAPSWGGAPLPG